MSRYDLVVIGGGTAGLVSSMIAAGAGARVALVEADRTGGDCLWTGCVPSKSLIAAADAAHRIREAPRFGVDAGEPRIDFDQVMAHVRGARETIAPHDSPERLRAAGVDVIEARARFRRRGEIETDTTTLLHRAAIVATGSAPQLPPIDGLADAEPLTSENLWDLRALPARLAVLGGGPIGCELGQAFARLGSEVTVIETAERLLPGEDPLVGKLLGARLDAEGVQVLSGARATDVRREDRAGNSIGVEVGGATRRVAFDRILVAAGRRPVSHGLWLDAVGVETDESGAVTVDERLRAAPGIYAAGDVTGAPAFTHVAAYHARIASINALFGARRKVDYSAVPRVTFTDPEVATVGLSETQARERWGDRTRVVVFDYSELDRAITAGRSYGFAKLIGDRRGRLVGATIAAPAAGESIAEVAAHLATKAGIDSLSTAIHAYPTFSEGPARAADEYQRQRLATPRTRMLTRPLLALLRLAIRPRR